MMWATAGQKILRPVKPPYLRTDFYEVGPQAPFPLEAPIRRRSFGRAQVDRLEHLHCSPMADVGMVLARSGGCLQ